MRNDYCENYLAHAKGEERKGHKYLSREWVKGKWQYVYDEKLGGKYKRTAEQHRQRMINNGENLNKAKDDRLHNWNKYDQQKKVNLQRRMDYLEKRTQEEMNRWVEDDMKYNTSAAKKVDDITNTAKSVKTTLDALKGKLPNPKEKEKYDNPIGPSEPGKDYGKKAEYDAPIGPSEPGRDYGEKVSEEVKDRIKEINENKDRRGLTDVPLQKYIDKGRQEEVYDGTMNPNYNPGVPDYSENCGFCTMAYLARRLGYDVEAMPDTLDDWTPGRGTTIMDRIEMFDNPKTNKPYTEKEFLKDGRYLEADANPGEALNKQSIQDIKRAIAKEYGNGGYGMVDVGWYVGGGHSMTVEVRNNGEVIFVDSQVHTEYKIEDLADMCTYMAFCKVDDLTMNDNAKKVLKKKGGK